MDNTAENKTEDVEMADVAPADAEEEAPKKKATAAASTLDSTSKMLQPEAPRFEIKKWNAVVSIYLLVSFFCYVIYYVIFLC